MIKVYDSCGCEIACKEIEYGQSVNSALLELIGESVFELGDRIVIEEGDE